MERGTVVVMVALVAFYVGLVSAHLIAWHDREQLAQTGVQSIVVCSNKPDRILGGMDSKYAPLNGGWDKRKMLGGCYILRHYPSGGGD
jgi:hypothetical protein